MKKRKVLFLIVAATVFLIACVLGADAVRRGGLAPDPGAGQAQQRGSLFAELTGGIAGKNSYSPVEHIPEDELVTADRILLGARREAENKTRYDASYAVMAYPGGDVEPGVGACTDVVIRAFRFAGIDLQQLIHEDIKENFDLYPNNWGLHAPDPNIDHRRVPNQMFFFTRCGTALALETADQLPEWQWGDVVYWRFRDGRDHCGIVSDHTRKDGLPLVIHNAGLAREEDALLRWEITGHFRYPSSEEEG